MTELGLYRVLLSTMERWPVAASHRPHLFPSPLREHTVNPPLMCLSPDLPRELWRLGRAVFSKQSGSLNSG
jgi:hypothetical protein